MSGFGPGARDLSIMIPTYNCAALLGETLEALKNQTLDISQAQIEVVDDCSTRDSPENVVRQVWGDRVSFFRQPQNVSAIPNFNSCIQRAERKWVYILHGDDFPAADGLEAFQRLIELRPTAEVMFGRVVLVNSVGVPFLISEPLGAEMSGDLGTNPEIWRSCPTQFVSTLVTKNAYEECGPFSDEFKHAADFWMWWNLASTHETAYTNRIGGYYRVFEGNHSSTLQREAINVAESIEVLKRIGVHLYGSVDRAEAAGHFDSIYDMAYNQALKFLSLGDVAAYRKNLDVVGATGLNPAPLARRERRRKWSRVLPRVKSLMRAT